jgi:hypothetical protein
MGYVICIFGGIIVGLIGGLLLSRSSPRKNKGGSAPLPPELYEKIKAILKHIEGGDEIIKEIDELLGEKES